MASSSVLKQVYHTTLEEERKAAARNFSPRGSGCHIVSYQRMEGNLQQAYLNILRFSVAARLFL